MSIRFVLLWILFIVAVLLRLLFIKDMEYKGDEYTLTVMAYRNVYGSTWAQTANHSSVGIPNPPFFVYVMSVPALFSSSPVVLTFWVILLNIVGLLLLLLVLRKLVAPPIALEAAALIASAPWAVVFSRKIWTPDVVFVFLVLFIALILSLMQRYKAWKLVAAIIVLSLLIQLHMSAWLLPLPLALYVLGNRPQLQRKTIWPLLLGLIGAFVIWLPYALFLSHDGFASLRGFLATRGGGTWSVQNIFWAFRLSGTQGFDYLLGSGMDEFSRPVIIRISQGVSAIYQVITIIGFLCLSWLLITRTRCFAHIDRVAPWEKLLSLLFLIFISIHACFVIFHIPAYPHYSIIFYPFLPLLFIVFLRLVVEKWLPVSRSFNSLLIAGVILANLMYSGSFLLFIHQHPSSIRGDYGVPYRFKQEEWHLRLQEELQRIQAMSSVPFQWGSSFFNPAHVPTS